MIDNNHYHKKHRKSHPKDYFRSVNIKFLIHELKGPLDVLETNIKMVESLGPLSETQRKALQRSKRSAAKLRNLIHSILEVGSSQNGRIDICSFDAVQCSTEVLVDALESVITKDLDISAAERDPVGFLEANGIHVSVLSELRGGLCVDQDRIKFSCILGNLVRNCLRFRKTLVHVELALEGNNLRISVSDDGPGIDIESVEKMIAHHAKKHSHHHHSKRKGHGIGLATARILARYLGGDLVIDQEYRDGARFFLTLPVKMDHKGAEKKGYDVDKTTP